MADGFNPRFYGEAGRTEELEAAKRQVEAGFNPRFYGEAGRTFGEVVDVSVIGGVSIPDFMGRPVELKK